MGDSRFRFVTDHLDQSDHSSNAATLAELNFHWVDKSPGAPAAFPNLELNTEFFKTSLPPVLVFLLAQGGTTMGFEHTGIPQYFLGGSTRVACLWRRTRCAEISISSSARDTCTVLLTLPPFVGERRLCHRDCMRSERCTTLPA